MMGYLDRFLGGFDDPTDAVARGGRIAALAFITGGFVAIPANALIGLEWAWVHVMPFVSLALGLICLAFPWRRVPPIALHLLAGLATALVSFSMAVASPAYAVYYVLVALFVALIFERPGAVIAHVAWISVGLFVPAFVGLYTGIDTLIIAVLEAPSLFLIAIIASRMQSKLQDGHRALYELSRRDELTGIGNYRCLQERLIEEVSRHSRHGRKFALVVLDLDGFKQVNERHGHLEGDRLLARVGRCLRDHVRTEDSVFRQGGDEFAVIAPETNAERAEDAARRLGEAVRGCCGDFDVTAGFGYAVYPADGSTGDDLLGYADMGLMAMKHGDRSERGRAGRPRPGVHV